MLELFYFFAGIGVFLSAIAIISAVISVILGYYALAVAEHLSGRNMVSGRLRIVFSFLLGLPLAYLFVLVKQYSYFAFIFAFSVVLAIGIYSFLRIRRGGLPEQKARLKKHDIAGFEEEPQVRKFRIKERLPVKLFELDDEPKRGHKSKHQSDSKSPVFRGVHEPKPAEPEKDSGLFGFLDNIPNPLKSESPLELAAKDFVLTRFGEKGAVERTWTKDGKSFALVNSPGGRYTLTLNSSNLVVDWDKD